MPLMTSASLLERAAGRGGAPLPSEAISRPEDRYPGLSELIRRMREKYRLDDTTIVQLLTRGEELFKANLPKDITPAQVDVEVFGRKPGLITRATAAAGKGWLSPAMRGLESSAGLPKGSIAIPEDVEAQASYMGGLPKLAGQFGRDLPLAAATGGASKLLSLAPLKTDLLVGGVLGAAQPMLEEGRLPTLGEVGTSAALVGGAGALLRRLLPTSRALKPGESAKRVEPDILQPGGQPPVEGPDLIRMLGGSGAVEARAGEAPAHIADIAKAVGLRPSEARALGAPAAAADYELSQVTTRATVRGATVQRMTKGGKWVTGPSPESEGIIELNMGFNPFRLFKGWKELVGPMFERPSEGSLKVARELSAVPLLSRQRLPEVIFRKAGEAGKKFWGKVEEFRLANDPDVIKYENLIDDILKPIHKDANAMEAFGKGLNTKEGYEATSGVVRAAVDRARLELFDPLYQRLSGAQAVAGRIPPAYLKDYFRHILDRPKTFQYIEEQLAHIEKLRAGATEADALMLGQQEAILRHMRSEFASKGLPIFIDKDVHRLTQAGLRELYKGEAAGKEVPLGALLERTMNLPTFLKDPALVMDSYMRSALRKIHLDPMLGEMASLSRQMPGEMQQRAVSFLRNLSGMRHPSATKWQGLMNRLGLQVNKLTRGNFDPLYASHVLDADRLSHLARNFEYFRTMYGNVGGALVNATQLMLNSFPMLSQEYGIPQAANLIVKAFTRSLGPEGRALAREMGATRAAGAVSLEGRPRLMEGLAGYGDLFGLMETNFLRPVSGIAKYMAEREVGGKTHEEAIKAGIQFIRKTQFQIDPTTLPEMFQGPAGRILYQFQSFKQQEFNFFWEHLTPKGKGIFAGVLLGIGGPSAVPILGPWIERAMEAAGAPEALTGGLPGLVGLDIGRRINPVEGLPSLASGPRVSELAGRTLQTSVGPAVNLGAALLESFLEVARLSPPAMKGQLDWGGVVGAAMSPLMRELEPVALQRAAQASEIAGTGEARAGRPSGTAFAMRQLRLPTGPLPTRFGGANIMESGPYALGPLQALGGIPTTARTKAEHLIEKEQELRSVHQEQRRRVVAGYLHFKATGDDNPFRDAVELAPGLDVKRMIREVEMPLEERVRRLTPKRFRSALYAGEQ